MICGNCGNQLGGAVERCPACGADAPTLATSQAAEGSSPPTSPAAGEAQRFVPGALLERRYRVVSLLGRGGMGEVYRADDLRLGHPVALKFLPERLASDPAALERFVAEVRVARRVSHPNVCRVHDLGEAQGQHFLTMELIDGEDLSSLLRRIGRLPGDKALELARQIGEGLKAAHESGVLHRDLKPANVMVDGRGRARITDFGLASLAGAYDHPGMVAGTPAYMAPEQLRGAAGDERSEIYALGLVYYELFTGKRAFAAATSLGELLRLREGPAPPSPGLLVKDLDPLVERAILRCLQPDPAQRPASAAEVLALLPGGDALAAAVAAGETPAPDVVAAAGVQGSLPAGLAVAAFAGVIVALGVLAGLAPSATLVGLARPTKAPAVLVEQARGLLASVPGQAPAVDHGFGYWQDSRFMVWRFDHPELAAGLEWSPALRFWYRESPTPMVPRETLSSDDPPFDRSGMGLVTFDAAGRLVSWLRVPDQIEPARAEELSTPEEVDWRPFLHAAGLDPHGAAATDSLWRPPFHADRRQALRVLFPESSVEMRVEMASLRGRPVYFEVVAPWQGPRRMPPPPAPARQSLGLGLLLAIFGTLFVLAALAARRNWQSGRADVRGAARLVRWLAPAALVGWLLTAHLPPAPRGLLDIVLAALVDEAALPAALLFGFYLALEPFLRRQAPRRIVSWARLLEGRWRDPLVGRDVLVGTLIGAVNAALVLALIVTFDGRRMDIDLLFLGAASTLGSLLGRPIAATVYSLAVMMLYQLFARWTSSELRSAVLYCALWTVIHVLLISRTPQALALFLVVSALSAFAISRFGLLTAGVQHFVYLACMQGPLTIDRGVSYFHNGVLCAVLLLALAGYGFATALGSRSLLPKNVLD